MARTLLLPLGLRIAEPGVGIVFEPDFDFFVDSVNGSDSNNGLTPATAFRTLAQLMTAAPDGVAGQRAALVAGSYFREILVPPGPQFTLGVYGNGQPPVIDGADIVIDTWTQPDVGTYPDVWSISWSRDETTPNSDEFLGLWRNGARPRLATGANLTAKLVDLQANGGWFGANLVAGTTDVYIKAASDPNATDDLYEIGKRDWGIDADATSGRDIALCTVIGPIEMKRHFGHDGSLRTISGSGNGASQSRLLLRDGVTHHAVTDANGMEDVIAIEMYPESAPGGRIPITNYRPVSTDYFHTDQRCFVFGLGPSVTPAQGFYSHGSGGTRPDESKLRQCYGKDLATGFSSDSTAFVMEGCFFDNCSPGAQILNTESSFRYGIGKMATVSGPRGFIDQGPVDPSIKTRLIENSCFYSPASGGANGAFVNLSTRNGSLTFRNCIFFVDDTAGPSIAIVSAATAGLLTVNIEYCIFVWPSGTTGHRTINAGTGVNIVSDHNLWIGPANVNFFWNSALRASLATWQAASGNDLNSVIDSAANRAEILSYFQGDPANGDFRLVDGLGTFADGQPLSLAGPQLHWDWNLRSPAAGAPSRFPEVPSTLDDQRDYIRNPLAWDFYPVSESAGAARAALFSDRVRREHLTRSLRFGHPDDARKTVATDLFFGEPT